VAGTVNCSARNGAVFAVTRWPQHQVRSSPTVRARRRTCAIEALDPKLLDLLVETVEDYAILMLDVEGRIASWTAAAERMKGYRSEEIIGRHFSVLYPPEDIAAGKPRRELEIVAAEGRLEDEGWRVRADGTRFWANVVITALRDPDGKLRGYGKVTRDLTDRRTVELALRASEERIRLMVDGVEDYAILMLDVHGRIVSWNAGARRMKGSGSADILGRHFSVLYPPEDIAAGKPGRELEIAAAEGRLEDEGWRVRADGTRFWADIVITALRDPDGNLCGYGKITRDLTERHVQEKIVRDREQLVAGVLATATDYSIIRTDLDGTINLFNTGAERMLGHRAEDVVGQCTPVVFHDVGEIAARAAELGLDAGFEVLAAAARRGEAEMREWTYVRKDGSRLAVVLTVNAVLDAGGRPDGFSGIAADVSERRVADAELRGTEERFRRAFDEAPVGLAITSASPDALGRYLDVNRAMCELTGYSRDRLLAMTSQSLTHPGDLDRDAVATSELLRGEVDRFQGELRYLRAAGEVIEVSVGVSLIRDGHGQPLNLITQVEDVSARNRSDRELQHLASHDSLTGLFNRARLHEAIDVHTARVRRYGPVGALLLIDLDHFKQVNDRLGHNAGDQVLISIARILQGRVREADVLGRLGGDEFGVLMTEGRQAEAQTLADDLSELVRRGDIVGGVTASIGISVFDGVERPTTQEILAEADRAMYAVKEAGRLGTPAANRRIAGE